jgi:hypothetical protein
VSGGVSGFMKGSVRGSSDAARILEAKDVERRRRLLREIREFRNTGLHPEGHLIL